MPAAPGRAAGRGGRPRTLAFCIKSAYSCIIMQTPLGFSFAGVARRAQAGAPRCRARRQRRAVRGRRLLHDEPRRRGAGDRCARARAGGEHPRGRRQQRQRERADRARRASRMSSRSATAFGERARRRAPMPMLTASTGVIGVRLPAGKVVAAAPQLVAALSAAPEPAAEAILTTDTRTKLASRTLDARRPRGHDLGDREGLGDDRAAARDDDRGRSRPTRRSRRRCSTARCATAIEPSFHCLVVDGDMSTNDTVLVLANGRAGNPLIADPGAELDAFTAALTVAVHRARARHRVRRRGRDAAARGRASPARRARRSRAISRGRSRRRRSSRRRSSAPIRTGAACSPPSARAPARRATPIDPHARRRSRSRA